MSSNPIGGMNVCVFHSVFVLSYESKRKRFETGRSTRPVGFNHQRGKNNYDLMRMLSGHNLSGIAMEISTLSHVHES
jgi:hypothetical protein